MRPERILHRIHLYREREKKKTININLELLAEYTRYTLIVFTVPSDGNVVGKKKNDYRSENPDGPNVWHLKVKTVRVNRTFLDDPVSFLIGRFVF